MPQPPRPHSDPIDPRWLLKAIAVVIVAALLCGYLTLCLLFYQGQWQLVLYPQRNNTPLTTLGGAPAQPIRFDAAETGSPRISGALLPAESGSRYANYTVLYLRPGSVSLAGSTADAQRLRILHDLGINIFAFDYRGSGQSDPTHPTQVRMTEDAQAAYRYLHDTRAIPERQIVLFGAGEGASLAANLAADHPAIPAVLLAPPWKSPLSEVLSQPRNRPFPVRLLFNQTFSLSILETLATPKLLVLTSTRPTEREPIPHAADPKFTLDLNPDLPSYARDLSTGISRFLDSNLSRGPSDLGPAIKE